MGVKPEDVGLRQGGQVQFIALEPGDREAVDPQVAGVDRHAADHGAEQVVAAPRAVPGAGGATAGLDRLVGRLGVEKLEFSLVGQGPGEPDQPAGDHVVPVGGEARDPGRRAPLLHRDGAGRRRGQRIGMERQLDRAGMRLDQEVGKRDLEGQLGADARDRNSDAGVFGHRLRVEDAAGLSLREVAGTAFELGPRHQRGGGVAQGDGEIDAVVSACGDLQRQRLALADLKRVAGDQLELGDAVAHGLPRLGGQ